MGAESVWAFPAKESKGRKICARAAALTEECDAQERAQTGRHERGRSVYSPRGGGWPTCSNSQRYPEEMKTSISAEPHTKSLSLPPMARSLSSVSTAGSGTVSPRLSAHLDPAQNQIQIP